MIAAAIPDGWTRLVLIRHGASAAPGRVIGRLDPPLSDEGRAQADRLTALLDGLALDAIYVSPLQRARETAQPLARIRQLDPIVRAGLAEVDFGALEGLTHDEVRAQHPEVHARWMAAPTEVQFPDGESWPLLRARVLGELRGLVRDHAGRSVALVAHGGPLRVILAHTLGLADAHAFRLDLQHGGVSIVDLGGEDALVRLLNRTP